MRLLLLSSGLGAVPAFLEEATGRPGPLRIGYVPDAALPLPDAAVSIPNAGLPDAALPNAALPDAARPAPGAPFASEERDRLAALGHEVEVVRVGGTPLARIESALDRVDAVYVAGGNTFVLLHALRSRGADAALVRRVRAGLPYIGLSAGSVVAGPTIAPIAPMDAASEAPGLSDLAALGLVDVVVVPHADGLSYPRTVIDRIVAESGATHPLRLLTDEEALLVDDAGTHLIPSRLTPPRG